MNFEELLEEANSEIAKHARPGEEVRSLTQRTLRYWIKEGLLPKRATRGPNTTYPKSMVDRVCLIRLLQTRNNHSLGQIKTEIQWLTDQDVSASLGKYRAKKNQKSRIKTPWQEEDDYGSMAFLDSSGAADPRFVKQLADTVNRLAANQSKIADSLRAPRYEKSLAFQVERISESNEKLMRFFEESRESLAESRVRRYPQPDDLYDLQKRVMGLEEALDSLRVEQNYQNLQLEKALVDLADSVKALGEKL